MNFDEFVPQGTFHKKCASSMLKPWKVLEKKLKITKKNIQSNESNLLRPLGQRSFLAKCDHS